MHRDIRFVIPEARAGVPLLAFLVQRFTYHDEAGWRARIAEGRVTVSGARALPEQVLKTGDELAYATDDLPEPPMDDRIALAHLDDDLVIVNKSGNLTCHPGGRYFNHTLWALLKSRYGIADPIFVNRIDRETSGLVVVGRTAPAAKNLRAQFASRTVDKSYLALVEGAFPATLSAAGWIVADYTGEVLKKRRFVPVRTADAFDPIACQPPAEAPSPDAEWAVTGFRLQQVHGPVSLVQVHLHTGRLHQIRATLQALEFPLVGDKMYGLDPGWFVRFCQDALTPEDRLRMRLDRQALHAAGLRFRHPRNGRAMVFNLPLPADMQAVVDACAAP